MSLVLVPVTRDDVRRFVGAHHRHNRPPVGGLFQVGCVAGEILVGVAILAAGFQLDAELGPRPSWDGGDRHRVQTDLFGEEIRPAGPKLRWRRDLVPGRSA